MSNVKRSPNRQRPWEQGADESGATFGGWLRRQREMREITVREIADASRISLRYLEALEADRFDVLPAPVFARGFLREYARYVGLDPDEVINHYLYAQQASQPETPPATRRKPKETASSVTYVLLFVAGLAGLIAIIVFASLWAERQRRPVPVAAIAPPPPLASAAPPREVVEPATGSPVTTPASPPTVAGAAGPVAAAAAPLVAEASNVSPLRVDLDFVAECWYEVRVDGGRPQSQTKIQGESLRLDAQREVSLTLGNAGGVRILLNGRPYPLEAQSGEVIHDLVLDLATAERLAAVP